MVFGAISALAVILMGWGMLAGFLAYSLCGAACTMVVAYLRMRCVENREHRQEMITAR